MTYQSPFSIRYGSKEMRILWSETAKRRVWRRVWLTVAEAQSSAGLATSEQIKDIRANVENIDLVRAAEIEGEIGHDLMAELKVYTEQCAVGGSILHWGLTSADVQDNADILRQRTSIAILTLKIKELLQVFAATIEKTSDNVIMGYTHLQPAEPTTLGYRLSMYAEDLLGRYDALIRLRHNLRTKGVRGPVGTSAAFVEMLANSDITAEELEKQVMESLGLCAYPVSGQIYTRIQDFTLIAELSALAGSLSKFGFDLRMMQSPGLGDIAEPFSASQVGSSAMPFKKNPVNAEKICSLARLVAAGLPVAWQNAANNLLERTLDDSANRRRLIPESFLACDEMLLTAIKIMSELIIDENASREQLEKYGTFASVARVLTALVEAGADRQTMHEHLRQQSMRAWDSVKSGNANPLVETLASDTIILKYLQPAAIRGFLDTSTYVGLAPERARDTVARIQARFETAQPEGNEA